MLTGVTYSSRITLLKLTTQENEMKNKVINLLVKWGNNEQDVLEMVNQNFEFASSKYKKASEIAEYIRCVY